MTKKNGELKFDIREGSVKASIDKLDSLVRAEYNTEHNFLDYYAGKENIDKVSSIKNQVIYGRRGTGKTHLLRALQEALIEDKTCKNFPVYIDMRGFKPLLSEEDSLYYSLIILKEIVIEILKCAYSNVTTLLDLNEWDPTQATSIDMTRSRLIKYLENFNATFEGNKFLKLGDVQFNETEINTLASSLCISPNPALSGSGECKKELNKSVTSIKYISFSELSETTKSFIDEFNVTAIYLLLDEWSEIPMKAQPILAELLKRSFITQKISLKIAAIPNRTQLSGDNFSGLEDGGDIFGYMLDNRYIYELNQDLTKSFFNELLFNHLYLINKSTYEQFYENDKKRVYYKFINSFLANQALREILIGSAGIPRDFLHIFINSYRHFIMRNTQQKHLALTDVRNGTIDWYRVDKQKAVESNHDAKILLDNIINEILINKKRCHFLIPEKYENNKPLNDLIDLRVIHLRKRGISHKGNKGIIYNVYYIDYACYTSSNIYHNQLNSNLLNEIETIDDFREIRRIALDDKFFTNFNIEIGNSIKCPHCGKTIDLSHPAYVKQHICHHCYEKID